MSEFILHSIPGSPFGRAVLATLAEKGAACRFNLVPPGGMKAAEHLARHPFGRIPVLEHDGFLLYETQAILRYLDRVLPGPALTPADPKAAARMDQMMNVSDWYLFQGVNNVIGFQRVIGPRLMGLTPDEAAIAEAMPRAQAVFAELSRALGDQAFFAGETLSLADLLIAPQVDFFQEMPEWGPLTEGRPNLAAWLARMNARPSMGATTWERVAALAA
ncbi:glutathione S-transferase [Caulobacter ginsengisoli]|uniref:glutathione transferase n=1 Tax=Caulobacter ginsengisoli TaxID=400775 RepID=A0ABU0IUS5_9CAUL|nr:glutathione S-transferase family protein [Caulobacter ginsengisoli]MDQ0465773.1 glutathione S-transferase [Caulobacter ginsengisoli]